MFVSKEAAQEFFDRYIKNKLPGLIAKTDANLGLEILQQHSKDRTHWHIKCVEKAREQYFKRYELEAMSEFGYYLLFWDIFLQKYGVWKVQNVTH